MLEQGPVEKTILEQCLRHRLPLPEKIANAPEIHVGLELFFQAYMELSNCRSFGFAEGPIPWLAIDRYCCINEIVGEQREDLFYYIERLDTTYLEWRAKTLKRQQGG